MPGMNASLEANDPLVVAAFHSALLRQGLALIVLVAVIGGGYLILHILEFLRAPGAQVEASPRPPFGHAEAPARRVLRFAFGAIWIFDGVLQGQPSMPLGLVPQVIQPAAAGSPSWVQQVGHPFIEVWSYHPVVAAAAAVWIQVGIGVWLIAAPRGNWSRLAGLASMLWGLNVWVVGEAFGGIFAGGLSWMFGAPGAALFYCAAGLLIALPESAWSTSRLGRYTVRAMGVFFIAMSILQAWPGRGFWDGKLHSGAASGALTSMVHQMSQTPQPHVLASVLSSFEGLVAADGLEVNLFVVVALALIGALFLTARPRLVRVGVWAGAALCLADWVLVQDLGFFGGVGTDPNSMIPMALLFIAGYVAIVKVPSPASDLELAAGLSVRERGPWQRLRTDPSYLLRSVAALGALGITLLGVIPMAVAASEPHADPIIAEALDGTPNPVDLSASNFGLVNQDDRPVSLRSLRGRTVALTFLDDVCTSDCPIIAQEFRLADGLLGRAASRVELVAINANPRYVAPDYVAAFDRQEKLEDVSNWLFLTGSLRQLEHAWSDYGATVEYSTGGAMVAHSDYTDVIDPQGRIRYVLDSDPGPGTEASKSSFSVTLARAIERAMRSS